MLADPKARSAIRDEAQSFVSMKHKASWRSGPAARKERDWITRLNSLIDRIRVRLCRPRGRQKSKLFSLKQVTTHLNSCRKLAVLAAGVRESSGRVVLRGLRGSSREVALTDVWRWMTRCGAGEDDDRSVAGGREAGDIGMMGEKERRRAGASQSCNRLSDCSSDGTGRRARPF